MPLVRLSADIRARTHLLGVPLMYLRTNLRELRGKHTVKEIAAASGINPATIRQIEQGRLVPLARQVEPLERAYGAELSAWYSPRALLALQEDEAA